MSAADGALRVALDDGVLTLTLDRAAKRNALDSRLVEALHAGFERADLDAGTRVVVLRGAGRDFCAGADLDELLASADRTLAENEMEARRLGAVFERIRALPKPVIAVVQGRAFAGGAGLATACDITIAGAGAQIGYPEIQRGFVPAMVMALLRRLAGEKVALELVLTGRVLSAEEARVSGLVTRVVPDADLDREADAIARKLAGAGHSALTLTKRLFYQLDAVPFSEGIALGAKVNALARQTKEFREAISQFLAR